MYILSAMNMPTGTGVPAFYSMLVVMLRKDYEQDAKIVSMTILGQSIPNPAGLGKVEIPYSISESIQQAEIQVFELATGRLIYNIDVKDNHGNASIETLELKSGMYGYRLLVDGKPVDNKKMVVLK